MEKFAVLIGALPVGPKCAQKAGLLKLARAGRGALRLAGMSHAKHKQAKHDCQTMSLFGDDQ